MMIYRFICNDRSRNSLKAITRESSNVNNIYDGEDDYDNCEV